MEDSMKNNVTVSDFDDNQQNIDEGSSDEVSLDLSCGSSSFDEDQSAVVESENEGNEGFPRVAPYQFEPYDESMSSSDSSRDADTDDPVVDRLNNIEWCQCGNCSVMETQRECICCQEITRVTDVIQQQDPEPVCITLHPGFEPVCLNQYVLETAYYQYRQQYREEIDDSPERYRYTAYRQLARWIWGYLGRHVRVILPSCAVKAIRQKFVTNNDSYTGFKPSS